MTLSIPSEHIPAPLPASSLTLVEQLVQWARRRIDERVFRPALRMPSIRKLAQDKGVSPATVVEAYERLVALGYLEARRGSGFYVRERDTIGLHGTVARVNGIGAVAGTDAGAGTKVDNGTGAAQASASLTRGLAPPVSSIDVAWLLSNMLQTTASDKAPGLGFLPAAWMDGDLLSNALKTVGRQSGSAMLRYGTKQGFLPLRQQLQVRLAETEIGAHPEQIVLLSGVTQAIDLVARVFVHPGDAVLVGDPAWFQMFGRFVDQGARLLGVPYTPQGPDLDALESLCETWRPKLLVINSLMQNPTGTSLSAAQAHRILQLAERYDFMVLEDDIYGDLCPTTNPAVRLASLDQLRRVIYINSFSKTLAPNLRVGYIACEAGLAQRFADQKMLAGLSSPELGERIIYRILTEGHYRRHIERLRARLDEVREGAITSLKAAGMSLFCEPTIGMFLWADAHVDSSGLTAAAYESGFLLAPGALFSPYQTPSTRIRINVANCSDPAFLAFVSDYIQRFGVERRGAA